MIHDSRVSGSFRSGTVAWDYVECFCMQKWNHGALSRHDDMFPTFIHVLTIFFASFLASASYCASHFSPSLALPVCPFVVEDVPAPWVLLFQVGSTLNDASASHGCSLIFSSSHLARGLCAKRPRCLGS